MRNRPVHMKVLAGERRPIRRRLLAFLRAGNPPPTRFFRICRVRKIRDQIGALFDARQHRADVRIFAVGKPHAMHALAGKFQIANLARLGGFFDAIDFYAGFVRHAGRHRFIEVRTLLILN